MLERLPDDFYSVKELEELDKLALKDSTRYNESEPVQKYVCIYEFWKAAGNTKIVTILSTPDPVSTCEALQRDWAHTKLTPVLGQMSDMQWNADAKLEAIYTVLYKHKFDTDITAKTSDRLYRHKAWFKELL